MTQADAILTVDLDAVAANYRTLCAMVEGGACAAVVKANAYGLGAVPVAKRLIREGCGVFFVATLDEALGLRTAVGKEPRIFILNGIASGGEACAAEAHLTPVLNTARSLERWRKEAARMGRHLPAALQVDSGMTRLGVAERDCIALAGDETAFAGIDLVLVMSHLACADEPSHPANKSQVVLFATLRRLFPHVPASLANSSGMFLGPAFHMDVTRPGAALYGINPTPLEANPMRPVVSLQARVVQTRSVGAGTSVGYGHAFRTKAEASLAVLGIGYADGWRRNVPLGARFEGVTLPRAGIVSMDTVIVDASAAPEDRITEGVLVDLIDGEQTVDAVAKAAGTIGYKILCALGARVTRRYRAQDEEDWTVS
jgi:alanine racemase